MNALSLFAGGGIGETYFDDIHVHTVIANELLQDRADIYKYRFQYFEAYFDVLFLHLLLFLFSLLR